MGNDNKQTYAQKKCLSKGDASVHTTNQKFRDGYDRIFRNGRRDWHGTQYIEVPVIHDECEIVDFELVAVDDSTESKGFLKPETSQCTKQADIPLHCSHIIQF